jgi:hypothetical protein
VFQCGKIRPLRTEAEPERVAAEQIDRLFDVVAIEGVDEPLVCVGHGVPVVHRCRVGKHVQ